MDFHKKRYIGSLELNVSGKKYLALGIIITILRHAKVFHILCLTLEKEKVSNNNLHFKVNFS